MLIRTFDPTGRRGPDISLNLSKAQAAEGLMMKGGDPALVDSAVPLAHVLRLFDRSEIERAGLARLKEIEPGSGEWRFIAAALENLTDLLAGGDRAFRAAQGGTPALTHDRFGIKHGHVGEPAGHAKTPNAPEPSRDPAAEDLKWQKRAGEAREVAGGHGWRTTAATGDSMQFHHPGRPGEELVIRSAGAWRYSDHHDPRDLAKSHEGPDLTLASFLDQLHSRKA